MRITGARPSAQNHRWTAKSRRGALKACRLVNHPDVLILEQNLYRRPTPYISHLDSHFWLQAGPKAIDLYDLAHAAREI